MDRYDTKLVNFMEESSEFLESMKSSPPRGRVTPYLESTLMLWLSRLRRARDTLVKGTRHISPFSSVEGVSILVFEIIRRA